LSEIEEKRKEAKGQKKPRMGFTMEEAGCFDGLAMMCAKEN